MTRADLKNLHPDDVPLWLAVETAVWRLALAAKTGVSRIRPMPRKMVTMTAGFYITPPDAKDKEIWLSLRKTSTGKKWGDRYPLHFLLDTIAHEVAHAKAGCGADHGPKFFRAFADMLVLAEDINIRVDIQSAQCKLEP